MGFVVTQGAPWWRPVRVSPGVVHVLPRCVRESLVCASGADVAVVKAEPNLRPGIGSAFALFAFFFSPDGEK